MENNDCRKTARSRGSQKGTSRTTKNMPSDSSAQTKKRRINLRIPALIILAVIVIMFGALYGTLKDYYIAYRDNERLTVELRLNQSRDQDMRDRIESLQTQQGIEDEARVSLNLVHPGDNAVSVDGVKAPEEGSPDKIKDEQIVIPQTRFTGICDFIFGVDTSKPGPPASTNKED